MHAPIPFAVLPVAAKESRILHAPRPSARRLPAAGAGAWRGLVRGGGFCLALAAGFIAPEVAAGVGADVPWTTLEAEEMRVVGQVIGPAYVPHGIELESSGQRCVRLDRAGDHVEFTAPAAFDALVVRYSVPDAPRGGGADTTLALTVNGMRVRELVPSSRRSWLYGNYPFSNDPAQGKPRNFYDELRVKGVAIAPGDVVRLEKVSDDGVPCTLDLVDFEKMAPPLAAPVGARSVREFGARGDGEADDTRALIDAVAAVAEKGGTVWVPPGDYKLTRDIVVPDGVTVQGAGLWHTTFLGDEALYREPARRVRFKLSGTDVHLADFAIVGRLDYRNDQEPNDGVVGTGCRNATVSRLWIEHTKAGVWVYNGVNLVIEGCRFRNLLADGVNLCVGTSHSVVQQCTARGTGDDCYAMWPVVSDQGFDDFAGRPGNNVIRRSTGQLTWLANGASLYGGRGNRVEDCLFTDIGTGCGILISTTFPTADEARGIDNNFSGTTVVANNRLVRCGGYDHTWAWRAALQICLDRRSIGGLRVSALTVSDSLSDGIAVVAPGSARGQGTLSDTVLEEVRVDGAGVGAPGRPGLWIREDARGSVVLLRSEVGPIQNDSTTFEVHSLR